jgi:hypothetical protein
MIRAWKQERSGRALMRVLRARLLPSQLTTVCDRTPRTTLMRTHDLAWSSASLPAFGRLSD